MSTDYNRAERLRLLNLAFDQVKAALLSGQLGPRALKETTIQLGILIDKRRLEEGKDKGTAAADPTSITTSTNIAREIEKMERDLAQELSDDVTD
jgi:hypothetical protein